jgi:hypothetical protein
MSFGPFSSMLTAPTYSAQNLPQNHVSGFTGPAGQVANILDQFMKGAALGRFQQFQQNELAKAKRHDGINDLMATMSRPGFDQSIAAQYQPQLLAWQSQDVLDSTKKADDKTPPGAFHKAIAGALSGILGPKAEKIEPLNPDLLLEMQQAIKNPNNWKLGAMPGVATHDLPTAPPPSQATPQISGPPIPQQSAPPPGMPAVAAAPPMAPLGPVVNGKPAAGPPEAVEPSAPVTTPPPTVSPVAAPIAYDPTAAVQSTPPPGAPPKQTVYQQDYINRVMASPDYAEYARYGRNLLDSSQVKATLATLPVRPTEEQRADIAERGARTNQYNANAEYMRGGMKNPVNMIVTTPDGRSTSHSVYSSSTADGRMQTMDVATGQPLVIPPGASTSFEKAAAPGAAKTISTANGFYQVMRNGTTRALTDEGDEALMPQVKMLPKVDQNGQLRMVNPVDGTSMQATDEDGQPIKMTTELQKIITREGYIDNRFWQRTDTQLAVALGKTRQQQAALTGSLKTIKNPALRAATQGQINDLMDQERAQLEAYRASTGAGTPARGGAKPTAKTTPPPGAPKPALSAQDYAAAAAAGGKAPASSAPPAAGGRGGRQVTGGAGKINVTAPDGSVHPFDTQEQADNFKKMAGIK